jgi:hypothetical protein
VIRVAKVKKPTNFDAKVKAPGDAWLNVNPDAKRPKALWEPYTITLSQAYGDRCGYAAMLDPTGGSVDHYLSFKNHPALAYEWSNYRFASNTLNSSKRNADGTVLDPQEVKPGWFKILLPSMQMVATDAVPKSHKAKAEFTLKRLKLCDGERIIRWRRSWYRMYLDGKLSLDGLREVAPLIAEAVSAAPATPKVR